jgi:hypothetical protein
MAAQHATHSHTKPAPDAVSHYGLAPILRARGIEAARRRQQGTQCELVAPDQGRHDCSHLAQGGEPTAGRLGQPSEAVLLFADVTGFDAPTCPSSRFGPFEGVPSSPPTNRTSSKRNSVSTAGSCSGVGRAFSLTTTSHPHAAGPTCRKHSLAMRLRRFRRTADGSSRRPITTPNRPTCCPFSAAETVNHCPDLRLRPRRARRNASPPVSLAKHGNPALASAVGG